MNTSSFMAAVASGALLFAPVALANGSRTLLADRLTSEATCACSSAADCTCKKGTCKCAKCGGGKKGTRMFESLKPVEVKLPDTARRDATAGVFI